MCYVMKKKNRDKQVTGIFKLFFNIGEFTFKTIMCSIIQIPENRIYLSIVQSFRIIIIFRQWYNWLYKFYESLNIFDTKATSFENNTYVHT